MAKGIRESEEEFNEQFVLDDESLNDLNLDDDALFADLDNEIRLDGEAGEESAGNGGSDAAGDEMGDLDLDLDSEDMGKLEIDLGDEGDTSADAGADASGDEGLDDLMGDSGGDDVLAAGGGDGLDDLLGDSGGDDALAGGGADGLDDLMGDSSGDDVLAAGAGDGLDDLMGDSGGDAELIDLGGDDEGGPDAELIDLGGDDEGGPDAELIDLGDAEDSDEELEELFAEGDEAPAAEAAGGDEVNLNAFEEELGQDEGEGGVSEISFDDDDLGDLNLDLGAEEISVDMGEGGDASDKEEIDLDLSDAEEGGAEEEISADDLGEEEFELPPLDEGEVEELDFGDVDEATFGQPEGPDVSLTVSVADDDLQLDEISLDEGEAVDEDEFMAAPDVDSSELDFHLGSLEESIEEEEGGLEEAGEEPFSVGDIPTFDSAGLDLGEGGPEEGEDFTAVDDVNLETDEVLELNLDNLDEGVGGEEYSNIAPATEEDVLEVPPDMGYQAPTRPAAGAEAYPTRAAPAAAPEAAGISTEILLSVPHQINVEMGSISLRGEDILALNYGSVVPLERTVGEPVDLVLEGRAIAQGEIVLINGKNLGVRIVAVNK